MKQATILLSIIFISIKVNAQDEISTKMKDSTGKHRKPVYVKIIDFLKDTMNLKNDTVKYNNKYSYRLTNINRFVYKEATAEQKGENLNTERPEILKGISFPGFITAKKASKSSNEAPDKDPEKFIIEKISNCKCLTIDEIKKSRKDVNTSLNFIKDKGGEFENNIKKFSTNYGLNKEMEKLKKETNLTWDEIYALKVKFFKDSLGLTGINNSAKGQITVKYKDLKESCVQLKDTISKETKNVTRILDSITTKYKKCLYDSLRYMRCLDSCCRNPVKGKICKQDSIYRSKEDNYTSLKDCMQKIQEFSDGLKDDLKAATASVEEIENALAEGKIEELENNYYQLVEKNFQLELESFIADKDMHEITFTTGAEGLLTFGKPAKRTIKINAVTYGGWKIDYSAGAFINFGSNKFLGPDYYYEDSVTGTMKAIREVKRTKGAMLSVGALMHIYPRLNLTGFGVRPGLALGVSTTAGFDVLNFHSGLSLIIGTPGKVNRVILSAGFTFREVKLLDSRFELDKFNNGYPDEIPTTKNFPVRGTFVSLTYNLVGVNK